MDYLKKSYNYYKFILIPILISIVLLLVILVLKVNEDILFKIFKATKEQTIYSDMDNKLQSFLSYNIPKTMSDIITYLINCFTPLSISFLIIYLNAIVLKYCSLLFNNIFIRGYYYLFHFLSNFKHTFIIMIFICIPFSQIFFISQKFSIFVFAILIISFIIGAYMTLKIKNPYYNWFFSKWLTINLAVTLVIFILFFIKIYIENHLEYDVLILIQTFTLIYFLFSILRISAKLALFFISFEFILAKKHKEASNEYSSYLSIKEIIKCKNEEELSNLIINISKEEKIFKSKYNKMVRRGEIIKNRNHVNLVISLSYIIIIFLVLYFKHSPEVIVFFIIILLTRLLSRSFEILKAFMNDALSSTTKQSNLDGNERIKLILSSLFEIIILSSGLKLLYLIFMKLESLLLSTYSVKETIMYLFDTFALQIFNVSFAIDSDFFNAMIHIVQISVSACLILLSLAVYSGNKGYKSIYEMTKENGVYYFTETLIMNTIEENEDVHTIANVEEANHTRYSPPKKDFSGFKEDWEEDRIDTELFKQIEFCYKEFENKVARHKEQTEFLLKLFDDIQKIKGFFKKLNRF